MIFSNSINETHIGMPLVVKVLSTSFLRGMAPALAAAVILTASGCQQSTAPSTEGATVDPTAKPGITATDGKLVLPVIPGRPAAAYFELRNEGPKPATLVGVHLEGAERAEIHDSRGGTMTAAKSLDIAASSELDFEPGGLHVMVFGLAPEVEAGQPVEMTLTFSGGDKLSMPLTAEAMGDHHEHSEGHTTMPEMQH